MQDAFSNLSKKSIYSLKYDYEKARVLKNIIEFKSNSSSVSFDEKSDYDMNLISGNFILKEAKPIKNIEKRSTNNNDSKWFQNSYL